MTDTLFELNEGSSQPEHESRTCTSCKGTKTDKYSAGKRCWACDGRGWFPPLDVQAIVTAIKGRKGLRSKRPDGRRSYYVWRLARFHGGIDVCLPMVAQWDIAGDPFDKELDLLSELVAKRAFGTDMAGARAWARVL